MGVTKFTVFATLISLTLSAASHAAGEPIVITNRANHEPAVHNSSEVTADQSSHRTVIQFTDAQIDTSPQVTMTPMIAASVQPSTVQSQTAPAIERVAHLVDTEPATVALKSLEANENLLEVVRNSSGTVLIDFYADWCGPCRKQSRILADMENTASQLDALILKVNVDDHRALAKQLSVRSLPTILVVKNGKVVTRQSGIADHNRIASLLSP